VHAKPTRITTLNTDILVITAPPNNAQAAKTDKERHGLLKAPSALEILAFPASEARRPTTPQESANRHPDTKNPRWSLSQ
jgi:hypothetical protein